MKLSWIAHRQEYLPPDKNEDSIGSKVASGSIWAGAEIGATTLLQFIRSIIFARLLMPAEFGTLSMATVFTEFILIFANFGFNASIIYYRSLTKKDLATSWWANQVIDGAVACLCCILAYFSRDLAENHTVSNIVYMLAVQFVVVSSGSINAAMLRRQFMFKQITIAKLAGVICSFLVAWFCVGVLKWGVYGLVTGMIAGNILMTLFFFCFLPWLPSFSFSLEHLRKHINYGGWFLGVSLVTYINGNMDRTIVGTYLNMSQLGYYEYAANIPLMVATKLSEALNSILLPVFSHIQSNLEQVGGLLCKVYRYNALVVYPMLTGIALVAPDFVIVAYGEEWVPIIGPLRLFCIFGVLRIFINPFYVLCNGIGKPRLPFIWATVFLPINIILVFIGVKYFGVLGAIGARLFSSIFTLFTLGKEILKIVDVKYFNLIKSVFPALVSCVFMALCIFIVRKLFAAILNEPFCRIIIDISTGFVAYVSFLLFFYKKDCSFLMRHLKFPK